MKTNLSLTFTLLALLSGCTDLSPPPPQATQATQATQESSTAAPQPVHVRIDSDGIIAAIGVAQKYKYDLDDGYGINFRSETDPPVKVEFREGRVNFAWSEFSDQPEQFAAINAENRTLIAKGLTYALGKQLSDTIIANIAKGTAESHDLSGFNVQTFPGSTQNMITIREN